MRGSYSAEFVDVYLPSSDLNMEALCSSEMFDLPTTSHGVTKQKTNFDK
jgi:hypothetical protein